MIREIARALEDGAVVAINHPIGGRRVPVFVFALADRPGFVFVEDGAFDPMYFGHPRHIIEGEGEGEGEGEAIGAGRWRFPPPPQHRSTPWGEPIIVEVIKPDDPLHAPALRARAWLESIGATGPAARERAMESVRDDLRVKLVGG